MLHMMRNKSSRALLFNGALSACLLAGSAAALAASVTVDLCATTGTMTTLPGAPSVAVLSYVAGTCPAAPPTPPAVVAPGGPVIDVNVGDVVTVNLYNSLPQATGLLFQGQPMVPDTTGAAAFNGTTYVSKSYTFTATKAGTYLYEAAPLPNTQHQVAMGLHGALVVRPATALQAYDDAATAFNDEAVLVLSEIDPALNNSTDPTAFDMRNFAPKYFLINGKPYPATDLISSASGNKLLLRYVNAGVKHHSMAVLGLRQNFVAKDASLLPLLSHNVVAETLAPGQTGDAIATLPTVATESKFAVYDASLSLHNSNMPGMGGMLTFVTAGTGTAAPGPTTSALALAPSSTNGSAPVSISATIGSAASTVTAAEYFVDTTGANAAGTAMSGTFGTASEAVNATLSVAQLAALSPGNHTIYVHGQDANSQWGGFKSAVLNLDKVGPATSGLTLTPNPSTGLVNVAIHATGNDTSTGGSNVVAAEYFRGATGAAGSGTPMTVNLAAPVVSLDATMAAPVAAGLVFVHSQDALGNWGAFTQTNLSVVAAGPVTTNVSAAKNPNNGAVPLTSGQPVVRVNATMTAAGATVAGAEAFIDTVNANGTGFPFVSADGLWNSAAETGYADIPLATINALSMGNHTIYVRGRDALGNWGSPSPATTTASWPADAKVVLVIDKTAPTLTSITLAGDTIAFGTNTSLTMVAADVGTGVVGGQYWFDGTTTPPANATAFTGTAPSINTSALAGGVHSVRVRVQDAATNWSAVASATLTVVQAINDARSITANNNATQTSDTSTGQRVLANDLPAGAAGRTASLLTAPIRSSGTGAGTLTVSCPATLGTAGPAVGGNSICSNGAYRVTLNGVGTTAAQRGASKRGTYSFGYGETLNGVTSNATVTITVN